MTTIEESLKTVLLAASGITDLIGARLHPMELPQEPTLPAVTFQRIAGPREHAMSEASGLAYPIFQITSWAETYTGVKALAAAVLAALDGQDVGASGTASIRNDTDMLDTETGWYYIPADYEIAHQE